MRGGPAAAAFLAMLLAGCADEPTAEPLVAEPEPTPDAMLDEGAEPEPPAPIIHRDAMDGRLEHGVRVCQPSTGECEVVRPINDDQELMIEGLEGTLISGTARVAWQPASPLTEELRLSVAWVPACNGCELTFIGGTIGPGPIEVALDAPLDLDGGTLWAYVRAPYANTFGDTYIQNDFQQTFELELEAEVLPPVGF